MSCPVCGKARDPKYRPFCSARCADVDLARWLNESYRLPDTTPDGDETPSTPAAPTRPH